MGGKCHNNIRPGVIFLVPVPAAIEKCRGVWQQWKQEINQSLSNCTKSGNSTVKAIAGPYGETEIYNICSVFYIHLIKTVMEIELAKKNEMKTYLSSEFE